MTPNGGKGSKSKSNIESNKRLIYCFNRLLRLNQNHKNCNKLLKSIEKICFRFKNSSFRGN